LVFSLWSVVFGLFLQGCATVYNPATGRREMIIISTPEEVEMGKSVHQSIARQYKFPDSPAKLERVRRVGERLAKVSDRQDYQYHFYVIEDKEMNAFTTPGGNVYMYTGLLDKLTSDDQVAAVLAHEIGHCAARHTVKKFQAALGYDLVSRIVLSQIGGDQAREITALSTNAVMSIVFSAYSRQDESEADRLGIKYAYLACYDPRGSIETFKILEAGSRGPEVPLFLRSHPYIRDRIGMVEEEIKSVGRKYGPAPCGGLWGL
ncbi:MAG: M48 family metalloprotease, partial [Candidatus Omnitrophica bacterium]|nr:M48 family metalloprotease [Candidatus Omnitrophota bacterium]